VNKKTIALTMILCSAGVLHNEILSKNMKNMPMKNMPMKDMHMKDMHMKSTLVESMQKFIFENETEKSCIAKFYYGGAEKFAQYSGFPIRPNTESTLQLDEFWWFEKRGLGLARKGEKSGVVDALMHHAANRLKIVIPGVGERDFNISGAQVVEDSYIIKIEYDKSKNIEIRLEKE